MMMVQSINHKVKNQEEKIQERMETLRARERGIESEEGRVGGGLECMNY
jgi:hypothetical protein